MSILSRRDLPPLVILIGFPFAYFWQATCGQAVWMTTDIMRLFYPFGFELSRALSQGHLPLWATGVSAGFPLLAEGQAGSLYPPNLLLYKFLSPHFALSYNILLHLAFAGSGMYVLVRSRVLSPVSAMFAAIVFGFGGVMLAQIFHPPIVFAMAWLPWLIFLQSRYQTEQNKLGAAIWFLLTMFAFGIQFLCGSVQMAFLNTIALLLFGLVGRWLWCAEPFKIRLFARDVMTTAGVVLLGGGIAAIQLIPSAELVNYSVRSSGLTQDMAASYSLPFEYLTQFVFPFVQGEPAEGNEEYRAYFGIAPLVLALSALFLRRNRQTIFFALFALGALAIALGENTPIYQLIAHLPLFNLFRVPARYLYWLVFAAGFLGACGFEAIIGKSNSSVEPQINPQPGKVLGNVVLGIVSVSAVLAVVVLASTQPLEFWLKVWQILPMILGLFILGVFGLVFTHKLAPCTFAITVIGLTIFDLVSHAPPYLQTIDQLTPAANVTVLPRSLSTFEPLSRGRAYTDESTFPSPPSIRNSLFPNTALLYDKESTQIYSSLAFGRQQAYLGNLSPTMLNLLNVRYFTIPLEPRPQTKWAIPYDALALDILNNEELFAPITATAIDIASFTERADNLTEGTLVGQVDIRRRDERMESFPLRVGIETADWDYDRKNAQPLRAQVAHSFPGFWRAFGRAFEGHTYLARFNLEPSEIVGVNVRVLQPGTYLTIEDITLYNAQGQPQSLAKLVGKNDFRVAYFSDTVVVWGNLDAMPRAFMVHAAEIADDSTAFARLRAPGFPADRLVLLADGQALYAVPTNSRDVVDIVDYQPERVQLSVTTEQAGYLVLADSWYPGWNATVDGQAAPIYRADVLFRAVRIESGTRTVVFEYRPQSFMLGVIVSVVSVLITIGISFLFARRNLSLNANS